MVSNDERVKDSHASTYPIWPTTPLKLMSDAALGCLCRVVVDPVSTEFCELLLDECERSMDTDVMAAKLRSADPGQGGFGNFREVLLEGLGPIMRPFVIFERSPSKIILKVRCLDVGVRLEVVLGCMARCEGNETKDDSAENTHSED